MSVLLAIALLGAAAGEQVTEPGQDAEITVIAQKLKQWRGHAQKKRGRWVCKIERSTGDAEIDQIGCKAMVSCFAELEPELQTIVQTNPDKKLRKPAVDAFFKNRMAPCALTRHSDGIAELAERRAGQ